MKLERVRSISVRGLSLQVLWQIDDHDGIKGALLHSRAKAHCLQKDSMTLRCLMMHAAIVHSQKASTPGLKDLHCSFATLNSKGWKPLATT